MLGITDTGRPGPTHGFDVSFNIFRPLTGMLKGGGFVAGVGSQGQSRQPKKNYRPRQLWIKVAGHPAPQPAKGVVLDGRDPPESIMYGAAAAEVLVLFTTVLQGDPVQVGLQFPNESNERVFHGLVRLSESESTQLRQCLDELLR